MKTSFKDIRNKLIDIIDNYLFTHNDEGVNFYELSEQNDNFICPEFNSMGHKIRVEHVYHSDGELCVDMYDIDTMKEFAVSDNEIPVECLNSVVAGLKEMQIPKYSFSPNENTRTVIEKIASELGEKLRLFPHISGPCGIRGEYRMALCKKDPNMIFDAIESRENEVFKLTITDEIDNCSGNKILYYDTGEKRIDNNVCPPGSLGDDSGFNNETAPLPQNVEEIYRILGYCKKNENH